MVCLRPYTLKHILSIIYHQIFEGVLYIHWSWFSARRGQDKGGGKDGEEVPRNSLLLPHLPIEIQLIYCLQIPPTWIHLFSSKPHPSSFLSLHTHVLQISPSQAVACIPSSQYLVIIEGDALSSVSEVWEWSSTLHCNYCSLEVTQSFLPTHSHPNSSLLLTAVYNPCNRKHMLSLYN